MTNSENYTKLTVELRCIAILIIIIKKKLFFNRNKFQAHLTININVKKKNDANAITSLPLLSSTHSPKCFFSKIKQGFGIRADKKHS